MNITMLGEDKLLLQVRLTGNTISLLDRLPANRKKWRGRELVVGTSNAAVDYIMRNWPDASWAEDTALVMAEWKAWKDNQKQMRMIADGDFLFKRTPMSHQLECLKRSGDSVEHALFMEQGTGKTKVIIDTANYLYNKGKISLVVIVAWPNGLHRNWIETELEQDIAVPYTAAYWQTGKRMQEKACNKMIQPDIYKRLRIVAFPVESVSGMKARKCITELVAANPDTMFVIDQSACIKNYKAKRTQFLLSLREQVAYRRILDGDPNSEGTQELFSQYKFLNPRILGHNTMTSFRAEFCKEISYGGIGLQGQNYVKLTPANLKLLQERAAPYTYRVLKRDCIDLPNKIYRQVRFDLTSEEMKAYKELANRGLFEFTPPNKDAEKVAIAQLAITKMLRCQQASNGWINATDNTDEGILRRANAQPIVPVPSRIIALRDLISGINGKILVFAKFVYDIEMIKKHLSEHWSVGTMYGGDSVDKRTDNKLKFMEGDTRILVGKHNVMGIGHTLTAADHIIFYTNEHSLRMRTESESRLERQGIAERIGVDGHITIWDLLAAGTGDAKILDALRNKKILSDAICGDPVSFFLEDNVVDCPSS